MLGSGVWATRMEFYDVFHWFACRKCSCVTCCWLFAFQRSHFAVCLMMCCSQTEFYEMGFDSCHSRRCVLWHVFNSLPSRFSIIRHVFDISCSHCMWFTTAVPELPRYRILKCRLLQHERGGQFPTTYALPRFPDRRCNCPQQKRQKLNETITIFAPMASLLRCDVGDVSSSTGILRRVVDVDASEKHLLCVRHA